MTAFVDTNILIYCFDESQPEKQGVAVTLIRRLLEANDPVMISTQVAVEFLNRVRRSKSPPAQVAAQLETLDLFLCAPTTIDTVRSAWTLCTTHSVSWFDALIVQSALDARCARLYSEDMQHRRVFAGVLEVINPFASGEPDATPATH